MPHALADLPSRRMSPADDAPPAAARESAAARAARITALVEDSEWADLSTRLTRYAFVCIRKQSFDVAEDIAQTAMTQVLDPHYKEWDPDREPKLFDHLCNVVRGIISNRRRTRALHRERAVEPEAIAEMPLVAADNQEAQLAHRQIAMTLADRLGRDFANDSVVAKVVALTVDGVTTPREQAAAAGEPIDEIRKARKRLFRGTAEVARELGLRQENDDVA